MAISCPAWGVVFRRKLLPRTIMDTEHGAMANFLVTECGIVVLATTSDEQISKAFFKEQDRRGGIDVLSVELCTVTVMERK